MERNSKENNNIIYNRRQANKNIQELDNVRHEFL